MNGKTPLKYWLSCLVQAGERIDRIKYDTLNKTIFIGTVDLLFELKLKRLKCHTLWCRHGPAGGGHGDDEARVGTRPLHPVREARARARCDRPQQAASHLPGRQDPVQSQVGRALLPLSQF